LGGAGTTIVAQGGRSRQARRVSIGGSQLEL
jgi:hypothetical protein